MLQLPLLLFHLTLFFQLLSYLLPGSKLGFSRILQTLKARFDGVQAFGYNSAENEPIWMKSGALRVHCLRLALANFGRDLHSSESRRSMRNFVLCQVSNTRLFLPVSRRLNFTKFEHSTSISEAMRTFGTAF